MRSTTKNKFRKIEQLHKILFVKKKNTAHAAQRWFCRVNRRQNESGVLRGGKSFRDNPRWGSVQNEHDHILWIESVHKVRVCVAMKAPVGLLSGRAVLRSKMEGRCPDKLCGICDREYHGSWGASRCFWKIYCGKATIVGLIDFWMRRWLFWKKMKYLKQS